jgi:hypothetical protein
MIIMKNNRAEFFSTKGKKITDIKGIASYSFSGSGKEVHHYMMIDGVKQEVYTKKQMIELGLVVPEELEEVESFEAPRF